MSLYKPWILLGFFPFVKLKAKLPLFLNVLISMKGH